MMSEEENKDLEDIKPTQSIDDNDDYEDEEDEEDDVEAGRLLTNQNYQAPTDEDKFIDTSKGEVIDKSKLTEFDVIKAVAKQTGTEIRNPRSGCKHCYGRGWVGKDFASQSPIPCSCIYPPKTQAQKIKDQSIDARNKPVTMNSKTIKKIKQLIKAEKKTILKQAAEEKSRLKTVEGTNQ